MQSHTGNAFVLSALMHATVIGLVLFFTYAINESTKEPPKVFELVAGEGDNYMATEAPALGTPNGAKVKMPDIPQLAPTPPAPAVAEPPAPTPTPPEPSPVRRAPEPVVERAPPTAGKPPPDAIRDFSKDVKRIATKREKRLEEKYRKEREAAERKAKEEELKKHRMTKEEFDRQNRAEAGARGQRIAKIDPEGIAKGVLGGSTANKVGGAGGPALRREEGDAMDLYFTLLKRRLHESLDKPPGLSDTLVTVVEFYIGADGTLSNAQVKKSSGSAEFDQAALETFAHVHSIGTKPDGKGETLTISFKMREEDEG